MPLNNPKIGSGLIRGERKLPYMNNNVTKNNFSKKKFFNEYKKVEIIKLGKSTELREI